MIWASGPRAQGVPPSQFRLCPGTFCSDGMPRWWMTDWPGHDDQGACSFREHFLCAAHPDLRWAQWPFSRSAGHTCAQAAPSTGPCAAESLLRPSSPWPPTMDAEAVTVDLRRGPWALREVRSALGGCSSALAAAPWNGLLRLCRHQKRPGGKWLVPRRGRKGLTGHWPDSEGS